MSPPVRYSYELQNLKGQSRRLFQYLTANAGRLIPYEDIAGAVLGDPEASDGSVQTAVYRLRTALEGFGSSEAAQAIGSEAGGYRFG